MGGFPEGFLWGAATSAYQVEGSLQADGRGESIWDVFCRMPGSVADGSCGEPACDHYRRFREDVRLMRELGLKAYRFSIAWPRLFPDGRGRARPEGLDFYRRLLDELHQAGIVPVATLYHWDLPQALQYRGGWTNRDTAWRFADYAAFLFERLGEQVPYWITVNEPSVVAVAGHLLGQHAPGLQDLQAAVHAAHHLLLAHGLAVLALRQAALRSRPQVGISLLFSPVEPAVDAPEHHEAARWVDTLAHQFFLEPLLRGAYPSAALELLQALGCPPPVRDGDLEHIRRPMDFLGVNYYTRQRVLHDPAARPLPVRWADPAGETTGAGWEVYPEGLARVLRELARQCGALPLLVTENGAAYPDEPDPQGEVHDSLRVEFLRRHLACLREAVAEGVPVRGYFVWSLLDGFEWEFGYTRRFGLVYVDFPTQRRLLKQSARWYRQVIESNDVPA